MKTSPQLDMFQQSTVSAGPVVGSGSHHTRWRGADRVLRSLASWRPRVGGPISDKPPEELRVLRARSRDAFRGHPIARAALTRSRTNIVGSGLACEPHVDYAVLGIDPAEAEAINADLKSRFSHWASDAVECDAEATLDLYGLQGLALLSAMLSGDCGALTPYELRPGCMYALKVQLIEADRIENPNYLINSNGLIDGVALTEIGQPVGYWVRDTHPGDQFQVLNMPMPSWTFYPAFGEVTGRRRALHIWNDKERPGEVRGAPYLSPVLEPLRQVTSWADNELMAAVVSALFTVFLEKSNDVVDPDGNAPPAFGTPMIPGGNPNHPQPPPGGSDVVAMGNAAVVELNPGEKATFANPNRPSAQFDPFFVAVVKQIGAALELPLDELLLQYNASYSAARAAMLQAWRFYTMRRGWLVQQFCQPIYELFVDEEVANGRVSLPGYSDPRRRNAWTQAIWIGPARGAMDELKEAQAVTERINNGTSNETIETIAQTGQSRDAVYAQRRREIDQRKRDGTWANRPNETVRVSPLTDPNAAPRGPGNPQDTPPTDEGGAA